MFHYIHLLATASLTFGAEQGFQNDFFLKKSCQLWQKIAQITEIYSGESEPKQYQGHTAAEWCETHQEAAD